MLPPSTGESSEVIFVSNDLLWQSSLESVVKSVFNTPIKGVNQVEPLFKVFQVNHNEFKSILKTHKNIIMISEGLSPFSQNDKWAIGQFVAQLKWSTNSDIFFNELLKLRERILLEELVSIRNDLKKTSNKLAEKKLLNDFKVECVVPKEYELIESTNNFFWATYNPQKSDEIKTLLIFTFEQKNNDLNSEVLYRTDSIFERYLRGERQESYVQIEKAYPPYYHNSVYRGLWRLEKGFMGGPFIIKTYLTENKVIVKIGLVFAPQSSKRKYIKEFEAIL
ncbi:MAG: hypothetical protein CMD08_01025 [Flavobacteriales bacterium]|nr:hypothetical protein [Flavobacteriales bacterium]